MRTTMTITTKTIQPRSIAILFETGKDFTINRKPQTGDNRSYLLSVLDTLNMLYESLKRLNYALDRKILEQNINRKNKGVKK